MTSQLPNLIRTNFWFNDGNIVLIAQNAAFKVHNGQLARHSEVFSDLFSLPQPSLSLKSSDGKEDCDLIDGCPFVILQDSPSDVFYFLSALYDGLYFTPSTVPTRLHPPSSSPSSASRPNTSSDPSSNGASSEGTVPDKLGLITYAYLPDCS